MVKAGTRVTVVKISGNGFTPLGYETTFEIYDNGEGGLVTKPANADLLGQHARGRRQGENFDVMSQGTGMQAFHIKKVEKIPSREKVETTLPLARGPEVLPELTS